MKSQGGLVAYLGVNDSREVEKMIADGNEEAKLIYDAMALNVARKVGEEAATVAGDIEAIILTGGIAYSEYFTKEVKKNVEWIAPVTVYPGENEMESLALGGLRVLRGQEEAHEFVRVE
jgi:butyrate kinase